MPYYFDKNDKRVDVSEQEMKRLNKLAERGWRDPDTYEPIGINAGEKDYLTKSPINGDYIAPHVQRRLNKLVERGWLDPDTYEPIEEFHLDNSPGIPKLPIDEQSLEQLRLSLLSLGFNEKNEIIGRCYFEIGRRSGRIFFDKSGSVENQYFDLCVNHKNETKTNICDVSEPLSISAPEYIRMATLLGKLTIDDSVNSSVLGEEYRTVLPSTFLYLQKRARNANGFKLNEVLDDMENNITALLAEIIKGPEEPKKD